MARKKGNAAPRRRRGYGTNNGQRLDAFRVQKGKRRSQPVAQDSPKISLAAISFRDGVAMGDRPIAHEPGEIVGNWSFPLVSLFRTYPRLRVSHFSRQ